ncbi:hypothetical protein [Pseudoalteromonas rubra]|uniref:hypothetical protein n=1 Tax=Pseudoalteromonas rubra TaxID=43658 RepID=UPI0010296DF3|nr:hypothetical protein [Pseudoalteromonas rubra]
MCALEKQPIGSKILQSIKNIKLSEININIPMVGKAPLKWGVEKLDIDKKALSLQDVLREIDGPLYMSTKREVKRISNLLSKTNFNVLWISNIECAKENEIGLIFLIIKYISPGITVVAEGAHTGKVKKTFEDKIKEICKNSELKLSLHEVKPFSENFARGLFDFLGLEREGVTFNYKKNLGYPVAIKFDLSEQSKSEVLGVKLESCFSDTEHTKKTLLLLGLLFATENRYANIISLADSLDVELSLSKPLENGIIRLTDIICELAHPQLARYISLTKRQEIYKMLSSYYSKGNEHIPIEIDLAAMAYIEMFDLALKLRLLNRGVFYILQKLSENNIAASEQVLSCVEEGIESLSLEQLSEPKVCKICDSVSLLRLQLNGLQCRLTGIAADPGNNSVIELLIYAQARMRLIDLRGSIALSEMAMSKIMLFKLSRNLFDWLYFCAAYIKLSCLIALGEFTDYKTEYQKLNTKIAGWKGKPIALFSLLPTYGLDKKESSENTVINDSYLAARANNNIACDRMVSDVSNEEISLTLRKSIECVAREGSIEVTFPLNNYALHAAFNSNLDEAIDAFFNMIDHCTYPYDYFSAYNNIAIVLAMKGSLEQAVEFCNKAHEYIESNTLNDPVFKIKSYFNRAVLNLFLGDEKYWLEFKSMSFNFKKLPSRYSDLLNKKVKYIEDNIGNHNILSSKRNNNIEICSALWPQNLQFWDFMYPIVSTKNIDEIIDSGIYND